MSHGVGGGTGGQAVKNSVLVVGGTQLQTYLVYKKSMVVF